MAKPPLREWDPAFLRPSDKPLAHSPWATMVGRFHNDFGADRPEESAESIALDQLPLVIAHRLEQVLQLRRLEEQVADLAERVDQLEARNGSVATIQTFAPEPYHLLSPISVTIEGDGSEEFAASFFDANISTAGASEQEAFDNLKNLILDVFDSLQREIPENLGPEPARQLAVLRSFIRGA